jgi:hypothetical protein
MEESEVESSDDDDYSRLEGMIAADICKNIQHKPIKTPRYQNPFTEEKTELFEQLLEEVLEAGAHRRELRDEVWEVVEMIPLGRGKQLQVDLGDESWRIRAQKWLVAVRLATRALE